MSRLVGYVGVESVKEVPIFRIISCKGSQISTGFCHYQVRNNFKDEIQRHCDSLNL